MIKEKVSLKEYNSMKIDCLALYFLEAKSKEDVVFGIKFAREKQIPFFVLGKGSNVIFPPLYSGLIIFLSMKDFKIKEENEKIVLFADAGAFLPEVAKEVSLKKGKGIEWAGGVPGTVGGGVRGNAGAFEDFMGDYVKEVEALNVKTLQKESFDKASCNFSYRESFFKRKGYYVVLNAKMIFPKKKTEDGKFEEYLNYRKENHPSNPSAGSVFKNPKVDDDFYLRYPETEKFKKMGFVPMRFLIESCNLKGEKEGGAQISLKHPNFIINTGSATGEDVKKLIEKIKKKIEENYGIKVEEEVEIL